MVVQTAPYGAHNIAPWSTLLWAEKGVSESTGKGRDEGIDLVHTAVHLLDAVRLKSRNLL